MYTQEACKARWTEWISPQIGDVRTELVREVSEYLNLTPIAVEERLKGASARFADEWRAKVTNPGDADEITRFYNESDAELFDLVEWHASDAIHYRTVICADIASRRPGRAFLDYGSGIGSDAIAFGRLGYDVTLADISEPLLRFARWRCQRRNIHPNVVDLKREPLPRAHFDAAVCFDVLEHLPRPLQAIRRIHTAMVPGGLMFMHAPFGQDPERPMHLVHDDVVSPRMRPAGFYRRTDLEEDFPTWMWPPRVYQAMDVTVVERFGYHVQDVLLPGSMTQRLGRLFRRFVPNRTPRPNPTVERASAAFEDRPS
jgi:2-polyprenyl-3-methyl-5-hydroxy-6-metoxy-1,4-benzoquinol methylase